MKKQIRSVFKAKKPGFTLVEVIVSIAIIIFISSIFFVNYRAGERQSRLQLAAQQLATNIRLAQNYALSQQFFQGDTPTGGWGIYFNTAQNDQYIIFADTDDSRQRNSDSSEDYRIINIPNEITLSALTLDAGVETVVSAVFEPPDPTTHLYDYDVIPNSGDDIVITLTESASGNSKTILVNILGMIDVD